MIDMKSPNVFGRNAQQANILIDHESCSRAHAALFWHGKIDKYFIVDLGSSHGTFVGQRRISAKQLVKIERGDEFSFGASTRRYTIESKADVLEKLNSGAGVGVALKESGIPDTL